jgi:hypothetical protein
VIVGAPATSAIGRVDVFADGAVTVIDCPGVTSIGWVHLSAISFRCAPSGVAGCA